MNKIAKRGKRRKANGKYNGLDPDEYLTPSEACEYAADLGIAINTNILALDRRDGIGLPYFRVNGNGIRYTPRHLNPYIEARRPRLVIPAGRRRN